MPGHEKKIVSSEVKIGAFEAQILKKKLQEKVEEPKVSLVFDKIIKALFLRVSDENSKHLRQAMFPLFS